MVGSSNCNRSPLIVSRIFSVGVHLSVFGDGNYRTGGGSGGAHALPREGESFRELKHSARHFDMLAASFTLMVSKSEPRLPVQRRFEYLRWRVFQSFTAISSEDGSQ